MICGDFNDLACVTISLNSLLVASSEPDAVSTRVKHLYRPQLSLQFKR